ncbi:MAG: radical SAM family heme chaperone HemW [Thermonemataceae bacterium]|nr:radical SAM family heme chaperone HemW [Thermonemataceae bacterium]
MSALYLHIPFCKQACFYCDFHFSTNQNAKDEYINALCEEIALQANYLSVKELKSIYFGGGTPSLLSQKNLEQIFEQISHFFTWDTQTEITLEANPDDLKISKLRELQKIGINRLSIGIQSFNEKNLQFLHRVHSSTEAEICVKNAQDIGLENISIDLIYAIAASSHQIWEDDLKKALELNVSHISAYSLTIEPQTVFGNWLKKDKIKPIDESFAAEQFEILIHTLQKAGYEHYEISNFAKNKQYAQHNTNYWLGKEYLGLGASAHSYDTFSRQYNVANNAKYIAHIQQGIVPAEKEKLSWKDKLNEYILTSLRTQWGTEKQKITEISEVDFWQLQKDILKNYQEKKWLLLEENKLLLSKEGKFFADQIAADLFIV